jgi:type II secretory pathway component PulF
VTLDDRCRGELCTGLGRALAAGLDPVRALDAVKDVCGGRLARALVRSAESVGRGNALSRTLALHGLVSPLDQLLLSTGEDAGQVDRVLDLLGQRYLRSHARWRKMKGRMLVPAFLLAIAVLTAPLPALVAGTLSGSRYLLDTLLLAALVAACVMLVRGVAARWRSHGSAPWITQLARAVPGLRKLSRLHEQAEICEALALCLECGLPARQSLRGLLRLQRGGPRRDNLLRAVASVEGGAPVADGLRTAGLLDGDGHAIVSAGEQAGRLPTALSHHAVGLNGRLDDVYDLLAQWLPVFAYAAVAGLIAAGILGVL